MKTSPTTTSANSFACCLLFLALLPSPTFADVDPSEAAVAPAPAPTLAAPAATTLAPVVQPSDTPHAVVVMAPAEVSAPVSASTAPAANDVAKDAQATQVSAPTAAAYIPAEKTESAVPAKTLPSTTTSAPADKTTVATPAAVEKKDLSSENKISAAVVDPVVKTEATTTSITPTPLPDSAPVVTPAKETQTAVSLIESTPSDKTLVALHLKPSLSSPVVLSLPADEIRNAVQEAGTFADGKKWSSIEREVTLTGYVDKAAIEKDLDIRRGSIVWTTPDKTSQLTIVENPAFVRLREMEGTMGKIEAKEPRVLYFTNEETSAPSSTSNAAAPKDSANPTAAKDASASDKTDDALKTEALNPSKEVPFAPTAASASAPEKPLPLPAPAEPVVDDNTLRHRGMAVSTAPQGNFRAIEGTLKKGNPLFGRKLYLVDEAGNHIAKIDKNSPIDWLTFQPYIGQTAVFSGELHETDDGLVLTVRSIRLR